MHRYKILAIRRFSTEIAGFLIDVKNSLFWFGIGCLGNIYDGTASYAMQSVALLSCSVHPIIFVGANQEARI